MPASPAFVLFMAFIVGTKLGMSQIYGDNGSVIPITVIEVDPNVVIQVKSEDKDSYKAVQVGSGTKKLIKKPQAGHFKDLGKFRTVKEFRNFKEGESYKPGDKIDVSIFEIGDLVKVTGISKGKGFSGAVKRHGFSGMPSSHGHKAVKRHVGSIGQRFPQHTLKGMRMAGRMGGVKSTTRGLKVVKIDKDNNLIAVKGAVPGNNGGTVMIQTQ